MVVIANSAFFMNGCGINIHALWYKQWSAKVFGNTCESLWHGRSYTGEFRRLYHAALHNKPKNVFKFLSQNLKTFLIQLLSLTLLHSYANIKEYCHIVFKGRGVVAALFVGYPYAIFGHIAYQ